MKSQLILLILILNQAQCIDLCRQFNTHKECILSEVDHCMWDNIRNACQQTKDYLQGCSNMLNRSACVRQIGTVIGELAKCRFVTYCEKIPNLYTEKCSSQLSKYACISILNKEEVCEWVNEKCQTVRDKSKIQESFVDSLYSASACQLITGYLIMHNSILWPLIDYSPDVITEALNQQRIELGIEVDLSQQYDDPQLVNMQNNYSQDGIFIWYIFRESKAITLTNLKMSQRSRAGCIALEIENDNDFLNLFSLEGTIYGVNHIYCKYVAMNTQNAMNSVFGDGVCVDVTEAQLRNDTFLSQNGIQCKSLIVDQCILLESLTKYCYIMGDSYEYQCVQVSNITESSNDQCTQAQCKLNELHYINLETLNCEKLCSDQMSRTACEQNSQCKWFNTINGVAVSQYNYMLTCGPTSGCEHSGLGKQYCQLLSDLCYWNEYTQRCSKITETQISYFNCSDANNALVCSLVSLSDQNCIWLKDRNQCINVSDDPLLKLHKFYHPLSAVNQNLCKQFDTVLAQYNSEMRTCDIVTSVTDFTKNNKYSCYSYSSLPCKWNLNLQICECGFDASLLNCSEQRYVNEKVCQVAKVNGSSSGCLYNSSTRSCFETTNYQTYGCANNGFNEEKCININKLGEYCQYEAGKCKDLSISYLNAILCPSLQKVNEQVCIQHQNLDIPCLYDQDHHSCYQPSVKSNNQCSEAMNRYACQQAQGRCYFNIIENKCVLLTENEMAEVFKCENSYVSKEVCVSIKTRDQKCFWKDSQQKCFNYTDTLFNNCQEYETQPERVCISLVTDVSREFTKDKFCEFYGSKCLADVTTISDCGSDRLINIHRCSGFTTGYCLFIDSQCQNFDKDTRVGQLYLNQISCSQANKYMCPYVTTPGQNCQWYEKVSGLLQDQKCGFVDISFTSNNCDYGSTIVNPNACALSPTYCYYDSTNKKCSTTKQNNFYCDSVGISQTICLNNSNGNCVWYNNQCQYFNFDIPYTCSQLSLKSCKSSRYNTCTLNSDSTSCITFSDTQQYTCSNSDDFDRLSQSICRLAQDSKCIQSGYGCTRIENTNKLNCQAPLINRLVCLNLPLQYCEFFQSKCQDALPRNCEQLTLAQCVQNIFYNCVIYNNQCITVNFTNILCSRYTQTNYKFCSQFDECLYNSGTSKCTQYIRNTDVSTTLDISTMDNAFSCTTTYTNTPLIYDSYCQLLSDLQSECPNLSFYANEATCNKFINCNFIISKSFGGFCSTKTLEQLHCEDLTNQLCLIDIQNSLKCYINDEGKCTTYTTKINQYNYQMNFFLSQEFRDSCLFDSLSYKCKSRIFQQNDCLAATTQMECSLVNNTCYYNKSLCNSSGTFDQINRLGCISLTDSTYLYNFSLMKCVQLSSQQSSCENLNKQACLTLTSTIFCQWYYGECRETIDLYSAQCADLNYHNCLEMENRHCIWKDNACEEVLTMANNCSNQISIYESSYQLCSKVVDVACIQNLDRKSCSTVSIKVEGCFGFGLNKIACLTMTKPNCYWTSDNYCALANLETIKCEDQVSKTTCLLITTPGQYCKWLDNQCAKIDSISTCDQADGMNGEQPCKAVKNEECEYNRVTYKCTKLEVKPIDCLDRYNEVACKLVQNKKCQFTNFTCNTQTINILRCNSYLNKEQCMKLQTLPCQWQYDQCVDFVSEMKYCKQLENVPNINAKSCLQYSIDPCTLVEGKCYPTITPSNLVSIYKFIDYDYEYDKTFIEGDCEDQQNLLDCVQSRIQKSCQWDNSKCVVFSDFDNATSCLQNFNKIACLNIRGLQQCSWQEECIKWSSPAPMTNVNINVCIENSINSIWQDYSCVIQDVTKITCDSIGISTSTCLALTFSECQVYLGKTCINFNESNEKNCYDYKLVSPYVCVKQEKYSCVYDQVNYSCRPFLETDSIDTLGLSRMACLSMTKVKTYWKENQCRILEEDIECDQDILVNSLACSSITAHSIPCMYDQINYKCVSLINTNSLTCLTQGLNLYSCVKVEFQPCIYKDSKCQIFRDFDTTCITLSNVNPSSCAALNNQQCLYDQLGLKCYLPLTSIQQCNTVGLSKRSCLNNSQCGWNQDIYSCSCKEETKLDQCQYSSAHDCDANQNCIWDYGRCVVKQCYHQKSGECSGTLFNKICYLTKFSNCQPASVCEDIIDPNQNCQQYYFNGIACQGTSRQCYSSTNLVNFCASSVDCLNENCIQSQGSCRIRFCSDIRSESLCSEKSNCVFFNGECIEIQSCSDILNFGVSYQEKLCNKAIVNGLKCNWQRAFIVDDTLTCTNKACDFYGASQKLCQGNESNNYACVLTYDSNCISCELISDSCFCKSQSNVCKYENSRCQSILCSDYLSATECSSTERCYWSEALGKCARTCQKLINEDECNERTGECHYDSLMKICKQGVEAIPDTTIIIQLEDIGAYQFTSIVIIGMIIS